MSTFRPSAGTSARATTLLLACAVCLRAAHAAQTVQVKIVTSSGDIVVALDADHAPKTVANFLRNVDAKFYDGGTFFRAIPGFVIQGGNRPHEKRSDPKLGLEPPSETGLLNTDGTIAMARSGDPNSATSEFFVCDGNQPTLDSSTTQPGYAAFGKVVEGMDVVRTIARLPTKGDALVTPVKILRIVRVDPAPAS